MEEGKKPFPWAVLIVASILVYLFVGKPFLERKGVVANITKSGIFQTQDASGGSMTTPRGGVLQQQGQPFTAQGTAQTQCQCTCESAYVGTVCVPFGQSEYSEPGWSTKCVCVNGQGRMVYK